MNTRWELVVALAREVDEDCAAGRKPDLTRVARLARAVIEFQQGLVGPVKAPRSVPPPRPEMTSETIPTVDPADDDVAGPPQAANERAS
jgi:hypothetical protein